MRDIFGVDLREGDALELWYGQDPNSDSDAVQIVPVSGCFEDGVGNIDIDSIKQIYGTKPGGGAIENMAKVYNGEQSGTVIRAPIGKVWATPLHHPFQSASK